MLSDGLGLALIRRNFIFERGVLEIQLSFYPWWGRLHPWDNKMETFE